MKRRTLLVLFVYGIMLSLCGGCSKSEKATEKPATGKTVTLKWAFWIPAPTEFIKAFNGSHKDIQIEYELINSDQYINIVNTRLMAGEGPDVFSPRYRDGYELLVKQDKVVELGDKPYMKNYTNAALKELTAANGKIYAFPECSLALFVFYNKDLFKKVGATEPKNWEEYLAVCEKLKKNGIAPQVQGCKDLWQNRYVGFDPIQILHMRDLKWGEKLLTGESKFTDSLMAEQFKKVETFIRKGYLLDGSIGLTFIQAWQLFCEGKAAMMGGGTWYSGQAFPQAKPGFDWGVISMPLNEKGAEPLVPYGVLSSHQVVNNAGKNVEQTMKFVEWFSQPENLKLYSSVTKQFSAGNNIVNDFSPEAKVFSEFLNAREKLIFVKEPAALTTDYNKVVQDMILGGKNATQAIDHLQKKVDALTKK